MAVDTSIQFNGYNSYKFNQGDKLACYPFGVEGMENITHSFGAYSPVSLVDKVRANTKFFDADSEIIQTVSHSFNISLGAFDKRDITVTVPLGAIKAQLTFTNSEVSPWWVATPKTEEGQNATPYAINAYGQLTYITPNGIYTGTLTANQIVLASGNESLSDRLVTINSNQISLQNNISVTDSKVTTIQAGQITLASKVDGLDTKTTKITSTGVYTGEIVANQVNFEGGRIGGYTVTGDNLVGNAITLKPSTIEIGTSKIESMGATALALKTAFLGVGNVGGTLGSSATIQWNTNSGTDVLAQSIMGSTTVFADNFQNTSDIRLKTQIESIPKDLLERLSSVESKIYTMKGKTKFGYIAQDVQREIFKYCLDATEDLQSANKKMKDFAILGNNESYLALLYGEVHTIKITTLENKIKEMGSKVEEMESTISNLSSTLNSIISSKK